MWYVSIEGIAKEFLEFLGYTLVSEDSEFCMYVDYGGDEYIVLKSRPYLLVHDFNDAALLSEKSKEARVLAAPARNPRRDDTAN